MPQPNKIAVEAYLNEKFTERDTELEKFELPVNPEQFAQRFQVKYDKKRPKGSQGVDQKFMSSAPEDLKLDFFFDGTNTIEGYVYKGESVPSQIARFKEIVYKMKGTIHRPRFVKVYLGPGIGTFNCLLSDLQITYTLFKPDGTPLRAKISASFKGHTEPERREKEQGTSSPDLTHERFVEAGDNLPLMVNRIYKEPELYLEVARFNDLTNFRRLKAGQQIFFPPVEKSSS